MTKLKAKTGSRPPSAVEAKLRRFYKVAKPHFDVLKSPAPDAEKLRAHYAIGQMLRQWFGERVEHASHPFVGSAKIVGYTASWLRAMRRFAQTCTEEEVEELCRREHICWRHVRLLLPFTAEKRRQFVKMIQQNRWTADQVWLEIRRRKGKDVQPWGGRPFLGAADPAACLQQLANLSRKWAAFANRVVLAEGQAAENATPRQSLVEKLRDLPPAKRTAGLLERLDEVTGQLDELRRAVRRVRAQLQEAAERLTRKRSTGKSRRH